jgi:hypothetical protein
LNVILHGKKDFAHDEIKEMARMQWNILQALSVITGVFVRRSRGDLTTERSRRCHNRSKRLE